MSNRQFPTASFAAANIARLFDAAEISELGAAHETANGIARDQQIDHGAELKLVRATPSIRPTPGGNYLELTDLPVAVAASDASEATLEEGRKWYARLAASDFLSRPTPGGNYLEDYTLASNSWV